MKSWTITYTFKKSNFKQTTICYWASFFVRKEEVPTPTANCPTNSGSLYKTQNYSKFHSIDYITMITRILEKWTVWYSIIGNLIPLLLCGTGTHSTMGTHKHSTMHQKNLI